MMAGDGRLTSIPLEFERVDNITDVNSGEAWP
jgi:hypothetical protein